MPTASFKPNILRAYGLGLLGLGIYLYLSFPSFPAQDPAKLIGVFPDTLVSVWSIWHFSIDQSLYSTQLAFAPVGSSLLLHNLAEIVSLPLSLLLSALSPTTTYNFLVVGVLLLNYLAGLSLVSKVSNSPAIVAGCALILTLHPFILGHIAGGHVNLFATFPLYLTIGLALSKEVSPLKIALGLLAVTLTDYYQLWVAGLSLVAVFLCGQNYLILKGLIGGCLVSSVKLIPAALLILSGDFTPNHDPALHSLPLGAVFNPHPLQFIGTTSNYDLNWAETGAYIGIGVTALILIARSKNTLRFLIPALFFLALACGPFGTLAPYKLLAATHLAPPVPARFLLGTLVFLTLSSALAISELRSRWFRWSVTALIILEFLPKTLPTMAVPDAPHILIFASAMGQPQANNQLLLDLTGPEQSMFNQTLHHHPIANGFLARRPISAERSNKHARRITERFCLEPNAEHYTVLISSLRDLGITGLIVSDTNQNISVECAKTLIEYNKGSPRQGNFAAAQPPA